MKRQLLISLLLSLVLSNIIAPVLSSSKLQQIPVNTSDPTPPEQPPPEIPPPDLVNSNKFYLSFQYACRQKVAFDSCTGNVLWNNEIVFNILATDYLLKHVTLTVYIEQGMNTLQFSGTGISDSYGLNIDNVKLRREDTQQNIVVNGNFEDPDLRKSWGYFTNIKGWKGKNIEIGNGNIYNRRWKSQVCQLDSTQNMQITQFFNFNSNLDLIPNTKQNKQNLKNQNELIYNLEFDWAVRTNAPSDINTALSSRANILWNHQIIASLSLIKDKIFINHVSIPVVLEEGQNILQLDGTGISDSHGISIDNVKLTSCFSSNNLVVNGDFEIPAISSTPGSQIIQTGGFTGWNASVYKIGWCKLFNNAWGPGQCIQLDPQNNVRYTQVIKINTFLYSSLKIQKVMQQKINQGHKMIQSRISQAQTRIANINQNMDALIKESNSFFNERFDTYMNDLYGNITFKIKNTKNSSTSLIFKYNPFSQEWKKYFGQSFQQDFKCQNLNFHILKGSCTISQIFGRIITCKDNNNLYRFQIGSCTHFQSQLPIPKIGSYLFWQGYQGLNKKIYLIIATLTKS